MRETTRQQAIWKGIAFPSSWRWEDRAVACTPLVHTCALKMIRLVLFIRFRVRWCGNFFSVHCEFPLGSESWARKGLWRGQLPPLGHTHHARIEAGTLRASSCSRMIQYSCKNCSPHCPSQNFGSSSKRAVCPLEIIIATQTGWLSLAWTISLFLRGVKVQASCSRAQSQGNYCGRTHGRHYGVRNETLS